MKPKYIDLEDHTRNDTWEGFTIGPVKFDGVIPTYPLSACRLHFRDCNDKLGYGLDSRDIDGFGDMTILSPSGWYVDIPEQPLNLTEGSWNWDFETTDTNNIVRTLYKGRFKIIYDVTHD